MLCETNLEESIESGNFSVRGYLPLIQKDSTTNMHGLSLCERGTSFCMGLISRKLCRFLLMFSTGITSLSVFTSSFSIDHLLHLSAQFLILCHLTQMRFSQSTHLLMLFVFGDVHHDWLTYSGGTDQPGELYYNFSISNDLNQMVNFPTRIPDCDSHSPALLDLFLSSDANICSTMGFNPLGNSDHVVVSVSIDFPANAQQVLIGMVFVII